MLFAILAPIVRSVLRRPRAILFGMPICVFRIRSLFLNFDSDHFCGYCLGHFDMCRDGTPYDAHPRIKDTRCLLFMASGNHG